MDFSLDANVFQVVYINIMYIYVICYHKSFVCTATLTLNDP